MDYPWQEGAQLEFLACEGSTIEGATEQIRGMWPNPDFVVLTLGGNDIGFKEVAKTCIYGRPSDETCREVMDEAWKLLYDDDYKREMWDFYDHIFSKMPLDYHHQIYHVGYPNHFNYKNPWCDDKSMALLKWLPSWMTTLFGWTEDPLSREFRTELANLTLHGKRRIMQTVSEYIDRKMPPDGAHAPGWYKNRLFFVDLDYNGDLEGGVLGGHRFCEPGVTDETFEDPSTWYFSINSPDVSIEHGQYRIHREDVLEKFDDVASGIFGGQSPHFLKRASHLRTVGHTAIKDHLKLALMQFRPNEAFDERCPLPRYPPLNDERQFVLDPVNPIRNPSCVCLAPSPKH